MVQSPSSTPTTAIPTFDQAAIASATVDIGAALPGGGFWAVRGSTLLTSTGAGTMWRPTIVPPPGFIFRYIAGQAFALDAGHLWTVTPGAGSTAQEGDPEDILHLEVHRTSDGGRSWQSSTVPGSYPDTYPTIVFVDAWHGYIVASALRNSEGASAVLSSVDGGRTWSLAGRRAWLGSLVSASDRETVWIGVAEQAGGRFEHPLLTVSRDGGRNWTDLELPGIRGQTDGECGCWLTGPPVFSSFESGAVAVSSVDADGRPTTRIFGTADGGVMWRAVAALPVEATAGLAVVDAHDWLLPIRGPAALERSTDGGVAWRPFPVPGLLATDAIIGISAGAARDAAALVSTTGARPWLDLSTDGGSTWRPASLP